MNRLNLVRALFDDVPIPYVQTPMPKENFKHDHLPCGTTGQHRCKAPMVSLVLFVILFFLWYVGHVSNVSLTTKRMMRSTVTSLKEDEKNGRYRFETPALDVVFEIGQSNDPYGKTLKLVRFKNILAGKTSELPELSYLFAVRQASVGTSEDVEILSSEDCILNERPILETTPMSPSSRPWTKRYAKLSASFVCKDYVVVDWSAELSNEEATFVIFRHRVRVLLRMKDRILVDLLAFGIPLNHARASGNTDITGLPMLIASRDDEGGGALFFASHETPLASNRLVRVGDRGRVLDAEDPERATHATSTFSRPALRVGQWSSAVIGVAAEKGQMRRALFDYLREARRIRGRRKMRPFLHYNSWFDFYSWQEPNKTFAATRTMNEENCIDRIETIARQLHRRGVEIDSFLLDDGWDSKTGLDRLWSFNKVNFPNGFGIVAEAASRERSAIGVWLSPWGGYGDAKKKRLDFGRAQGFETNENGFSIAGPRYRKRFRDIALSMVSQYNVNQFKFDGVAGSSDVVADEMTSLLALVDELKETSLSQQTVEKSSSSKEEEEEEDPNRANDRVFINLTTGTWPSIFWLLHGDSIWRGNVDLGLHGSGTNRRRWITFRDAVVYKLVVERSPYFPLTGLMLHGVVTGMVGQSRWLHLHEVDPKADFAEDVWAYFATGTTLQELYVSPDAMSPEAWDVVASAAAWSRRRAEVLLDSHWVVGDPSRSEAYALASWKREVGVLYLRNPAETTRTLNIRLRDAFEWSPSVRIETAVISAKYDSEHFRCERVGGTVDVDGSCRVAGDAPVSIAMAPFEVAVLEVFS